MRRVERITKVCPTCGSEFQVLPSSSHVKACSMKCRVVPPKHGGAGTRLYRIWTSMKGRCSNPENRSFKYYGARGITVCQLWKSSFAEFQKWALANGYQADLEIDRRIGSVGYNPGNCRWVTRKQQNRNTGKKRPGQSASKFKGVFFDKARNRWRAAIRGNDGRSKYLGLFGSEVDAAKAYDAAATEIQGEFARLNFN